MEEFKIIQQYIKTGEYSIYNLKSNGDNAKLEYSELDNQVYEHYRGKTVCSYKDLDNYVVIKFKDKKIKLEYDEIAYLRVLLEAHNTEKYKITKFVEVK